MAKSKYARKVIQQLQGEDYPFGKKEEAEMPSFAEMFDFTYFDRLEPKYRRGESAQTAHFSVKDYPPPQKSLDLHGCTGQEAELKTVSFIANSRRQGLQTIQIITGKGLHSPGGKAVLPDVVEQQLRLLKRQGDLVSFRWEKRVKGKSGMVLVYL